MLVITAARHAGQNAISPCAALAQHLDRAFLQENDLKQIFEPFGAVELVTLQRDASGRSQGIGHVQYVPALAVFATIEPFSFLRLQM